MERPTDPSVLETVLSPPPSLTASSSAAEDEGRFAPGALLGGRYRISGLLGRGGMGEVYRATDLTLGQSVALKFLPEEASQNPRLLERFHGEVRIARLVSHPNVCRVFDIGEVNGTPYLSMEYVDGEDLASLLTRIGRLPNDKALEIARKLCAGLAAAHDRGVIHRDLKPQNIMINKRGEVLIMDFGLAAVAQELSGTEAHSGTPAYMAPEQLRGTSVTARSDIYSLGLVLYELFTGRKPFDAKTLQQLMDMQESAHLPSMTSVAADIDPAVEKVIRRCLAPDSQKRPATALAVAAALPGSDPLAAALAAGETPSPEVVAAAGVTEGLPRKYSVPCLLFVLVCLAVAPWNNQLNRAMTHAALEDSPDVLAHKSREIAASFGYAKKPADSALWLNHRGELVSYLQRLPKPTKWDEWLQAEAPIQAVYRESPEPLAARPDGRVDFDNPPQTKPGMAGIVLDGHGKLHWFQAAPYQDAAEHTPPVDPATVFRAAELDIATFRETAPSMTPLHAASEVRAWKGPHPKLPNTEVKVQIASWKGRISEASVDYPWTQADRASSAVRDVSIGVYVALALVGGLFGCLLARRNWKLNRSDRQGALRVACARFLLGAVAWLGIFHPAPGNLLNHAGAAAGDCLLSSAVLWILYIALEPAVRARWPHSIVTWNRLLAGRWGDAQVGAHLLIGAAVGCGVWECFVAIGLVTRHDDLTASGGLWYALGTRTWIAMHAGRLATGLSAGLFVFFVIFGLRRLLRFDILAALGTAVVFTLTEGEFARAGGDWLITGAVFVAVYAILIFVLLRFGLVALLSALFFVNSFNGILVGSDWRTWYTPASVATMLLLSGIALAAFWRSLGNRELISGEELPVAVSRAAA
jgi:serine/threonine-protein kinase